jgi:predicted metal-dependent phosphoesterase TrpH
LSDSTGQNVQGSRYDSKTPAVHTEWPVEVDLHLHTTASDGTLTPTQLIEQISSTTLRTVAITDHDSTEGVAEAIEAANATSNLTVIPGIELGTENEDSELHLLGYFIDINHPELQKTLKQFRSERFDAARAMVDKLEEIKRPVSWERVVEMAGGSIGRPHIARAIVEAGHVDTIAEAFDRFLGEKGIARVPRPKLHPVEALKLIHSAGGIGTIAHPRTVRNLNPLVAELVKSGLAGIEVYAEKYNSDRRDSYIDIATRFDLVPTGGTDYHALGTKNETTPGTNGPPPNTVENLVDRAKQKHGPNVGNIPSGLA